MMIDLKINLTIEQISHINNSKNKRTKLRRIKDITGISAGTIYEHLEDCDTTKLTRCGFCGSIRNLGSLDYTIKNNLLYLTNIKYVNDTNIKICSRNDTIETKLCKSKKLNPNSIEFVKVAYGFKNDEEANEYILNRNSSPFYSHNHESIEDYKKYQTRDLDWFGDIDRYREYIELRKFSLSRENLINIYGEDGYEEINKSKDSMSKNFCRSKYGDDWEEQYSKRCNEVKTTRENFITRYGEIDGNIKWNEYIENQRKKSIEYFNSLTISERSLIFDTTSKESFKRRFKDDWEDEYKAHQKKIQTQAQRASKESLKFYDLLINKLDKYDIIYYIGKEGNNEWFIWDDIEREVKFYDFCIPELGIIIEFHGSLWHYNPAHDYTKRTLPFGMSIEENKAKDLYKAELAKSKGFDYYVIFDTDDYEYKAEEMYGVITNKLKEMKNE